MSKYSMKIVNQKKNLANKMKSLLIGIKMKVSENNRFKFMCTIRKEIKKRIGFQK